MRRTTLWASALFALAIGLSSTAHAQYPHPRRTLTVDPGALLDGRFNFEFESAFNRWIAWNLGVNFLFFDGVFDRTETTYFGVGPKLGLRLFLVGDAPAGLWIGPFADLYYISREADSGRREGGFGYGFGGELGITLILLRALVLSFGAGVSYSDLVERTGVDPRFRFGVGVAF